MKLLALTAAGFGLALAACTPAPPQTCERTTGMFAKDGTPIMIGEPCVIAPSAVAQHINWPRNDRTERPVDVSPPTTPEEPTTPPVEPPSEPDTPPVVEPPVVEPPVVEPPVVEPPVVEPPVTAPGCKGRDGRSCGDNSDANGTGGNRHDREDFTHGGTEVAEDKKEAEKSVDRTKPDE